MKRTGHLKNVLRAGTVVLLAGIVALSSAGCRSMIELALMEKAERAEAKPMEVTDLYSEAEGYHYPGFHWGQEFAEFQKVTNYSVTDMEGYTDTETVYTAAELRVSFFGRANDRASIGCRGKDEVAFVSFNFDRDSDPETFADFAEQLNGALEAAFGAPDDVVTRSEEVEGKLYNYRTGFWRKTVGGKMTELQIGTATLPGSSSPNYLSLGVDWHPEEETKE